MGYFRLTHVVLIYIESNYYICLDNKMLRYYFTIVATIRAYLAV